LVSKKLTWSIVRRFSSCVTAKTAKSNCVTVLPIFGNESSANALKYPYPGIIAENSAIAEGEQRRENLKVSVSEELKGSTALVTGASRGILASARNIVAEVVSIRSGGWQRTAGDEIHGKILGVLGLGNIGSEVARIGRAFGMEVMERKP
jgi:hypothetical protein